MLRPASILKIRAAMIQVYSGPLLFSSMAKGFSWRQDQEIDI